MVPDFFNRPSSSTPNFIKRNIQNCGNPARLSSAPAEGLGFGIRGIPLYIRTREKLKSKEVTQKVEPTPFLGQKTFQTTKDCVQKPVFENHPEVSLPSHFRVHRGVRRTSIKSKGSLLPQNLKNKDEDSSSSRTNTTRQGNYLRVRWHTNREVLRLPVTTIPEPERPALPPEVFLQVTGHSIKRVGTELWEALDNHLQRRSGKAFEGLLAAMEGQTKSNVNSSHIHGGHRCTNGNSLDNKGVDLRQESNLDNSYHNIYKQHLNTLSSVLTQDQQQHQEENVKPRQKKKLPPKLEIKIAGEVQSRNSDMQLITQGLEEVSVLEELDNCGDLTPVITYNHVSTVNSLEEFGKAVSPGGSSKNSRSPSPLLDIPNSSGGKNTKRPPL